jgi:hypothetical protein
MEDLSRFTGPARGSTRLAAYRARLNGATGAEAGLSAALARVERSPVQATARTTTARATTTSTTAKAKASTGTHDRVKFVAHAVETDPALQGKAGLAIQMLADPDYAGVSGSGVVKLLKAGATATAPTAQDVATARDQAMRSEMRKAIGSTGNSNVSPDGGSAKSANGGGSWSRVIADMNARNGFTADAGSVDASATAGSWGRAIADMNRRNGFN